MYKFLLCVWMLLPLLSHAQEVDRYVVFLKDKEQNIFSLEKPEEFLSERAINRRIRQQIPLSLTDLPVSPQYIEKIKGTGAKVFYSSRWFNALLIEAEAETVQEITALAEVLDVLFVAPGAKLKKEIAVPNSRTSRETGNTTFLPETFQNSILGIPELQEKGFIGEGKLIAVLDGGFEAVNTLPYFNHLFEKGKLLGQYDFTTSTTEVFRYSDHGTKALSTISAIDSSTFIGTAPGAGILLAITEDVKSEFVIEEYNWLLGAEWADSAGADVITASLGYSTFDDPSMNYSYSDLNGKTTVSARAAQLASERGMVVVVSAGNSGNDAWKYIVTPADAEGVISVGAIQENKEIANFSSRGPSADGRIKPDVVALGYRTVVAEKTGGFTIGYGTSFAAPQIAGLVASVWEAFPDYSSKEIRQMVLSSGDRASLPDSVYGWGIPSFTQLEANVLQLGGTEEPEVVKIFPNPVQKGKLFLEFEKRGEPEVKISLFSSTGQQLLNDQKLSEISTDGRIFALDLGGLNEGVFFLHIFRGHQQFIHKILKY